MARCDPETNPAAFLGGELRRARVAAGFSSQDALAAKLGFDRTVIAKAETGQRPPTVDVLAAWCQACGLDDELFARLAVEDVTTETRSLVRRAANIFVRVQADALPRAASRTLILEAAEQWKTR